MDNLANNTAREHGESSRAPSQTVGGRQHSNTGNGIGSSSSYVPRLVKLDFPRFNGGEDPTSWLCRAGQFFQFQATPEADRVSLASFHLEGDAQLCALRDSIRADVQAGRPTTLTAAIGLARVYEARNLSQRRINPLVPKNNHQPDKNTTHYQPVIPVRKMTPTELQDRRNKGHCYNCDEKFKPGHRCKKLFVIEACLDEDDGDLIMEEDREDENQLMENPEISLHAINGVRTAETM
ncbi:hypothetical protein F0562_008022 [Nyssa sinensis]|uniref:Retrotransposon gag domain-containing protein n=1 Tax=Nyssa sinensis TaxID=561372 RepID=A0A5J5A7K3_9ASTE|nr:hypothetical protein F0562_008022 [Nyssa sinensis]